MHCSKCTKSFFSPPASDIYIGVRLNLNSRIIGEGSFLWAVLAPHDKSLSISTAMIKDLTPKIKMYNSCYEYTNIT